MMYFVQHEQGGFLFGVGHDLLYLNRIRQRVIGQHDTVIAALLGGPFGVQKHVELLDIVSPLGAQVRVRHEHDDTTDIPGIS